LRWVLNLLAKIMNNKLLSQIEALLFIYGEPLETKKLAKILGAKEEETQSGLLHLEEELKKEGRGLVLIRDKTKVQLATKPEMAELLKDVAKQEFTEELSPASLETLAIVAYAGPITRADIEYIRGVNSSFTLRSLLLRGLVSREVDPKRMNAYIYSASFELLRHLGLSQNKDLPEYQKYKSLVEQLHQTLQTKEQAENKIESQNNGG